jgi:hypothetical protein
LTETFAVCDHSGNNHTGTYTGNADKTTLPNGDTALVMASVSP